MKVIIYSLIISALAFSSCRRKGCTDPEASNYDEKAKVDDGTCISGLDPNDFDRLPMLTNLGENVILPSYQELDSLASLMHASSQAFIAASNQTTLDKLREDWQNALIAWQYAGYFEFGPADNNFLRAQVNVYPTDTAQIHSNLSSGTYDLNSAMNYDAKGFQAIDYLLFGLDTNDLALISAYQNDNTLGTYLNDLTGDISSLVAAVRNEWEPSNGDYLSTFINNTSLDIGGSCNFLFNAFVMHFEGFVRSGKLGIPAGALSFSQTPLPDRVECYYHNNLSKLMLDHAFIGLYNIYNGTNKQGADGVGFKEYLDYLETQGPSGRLSNDINTQINQAQSDANIKLNDPLSDFVSNDQAIAIDVWDEMQYLVILLKNDLKSAIGLSITYADTDGD